MPRSSCVAFAIGTVISVMVAFFLLLPVTIPTATLTLGEKSISVRVASNALTRFWVVYGQVFHQWGRVNWYYSFPAPATHTFSLAGEESPVDVVWLSHGVITAIDRAVQPGSSCQRSATDGFLVLSSGAADAYQLREGMQIMYK